MFKISPLKQKYSVKTYKETSMLTHYNSDVRKDTDWKEVILNYSPKL